MTDMHTEDITITEIVGDMSIACDFAGHPTCSDEAAEWVLHRTGCECGFGGVALTCTKCKDDRLLAEEDFMVKCQNCGHYIPVREAYSYFEPLSRPR